MSSDECIIGCIREEIVLEEGHTITKFVQIFGDCMGSICGLHCIALHCNAWCNSFQVCGCLFGSIHRFDIIWLTRRVIPSVVHCQGFTGIAWEESAGTAVINSNRSGLERGEFGCRRTKSEITQSIQDWIDKTAAISPIAVKRRNWKKREQMIRKERNWRLLWET